jgi:hypothetical protein
MSALRLVEAEVVAPLLLPRQHLHCEYMHIIPSV